MSSCMYVFLSFLLSVFPSCRLAVFPSFRLSVLLWMGLVIIVHLRVPLVLINLETPKTFSETLHAYDQGDPSSKIYKTISRSFKWIIIAQQYSCEFI